MSAEFYRTAAANLDRIAGDVTSCDSKTVSVCATRLPEILQGAATPHLVGQLTDCSADLMSARNILTTAARRARVSAEQIEAAAVVEAAAAAAAEEAAAEAEEPPAMIPDPIIGIV